jgi:CheY-like chemotaxis protein
MLREQLPSEPAPVVLIVEDDVLLRLTIAGSLRDAGFEVLEAANAAEAVQILKCIPVDALFSDIDMPGRMDGCALAQWVHQRELNVRIILTSGPDRALGDAGEYVSYLSKPYASDEVEHLLRSVLPSLPS